MWIIGDLIDSFLEWIEAGGLFHGKAITNGHHGDDTSSGDSQGAGTTLESEVLDWLWEGATCDTLASVSQVPNLHSAVLGGTDHHVLVIGHELDLLDVVSMGCLEEDTRGLFSLLYVPEFDTGFISA